MKTKTAIDATVEYFFKRTNEQIVVKALFYSEGLNMSLKTAQKALGFKDISSVKKSITALDGYRINKQGFNESFLKAEKDVYKFIQHKRMKNHLKEVRGIANRLTMKYDVLISKQEQC